MTQINDNIKFDEDERQSLIVILEPFTHGSFFEQFLTRVQRVNLTYDDEVQSLTEENLSQLRQAMQGAI
ncbi:MAG: hypothetical protein ACO3C3_05940, partial [Burkholderiaceae bacterium]